MAKDFSTMEHSNASRNPSIHQISNPQRRTVVQGSVVASLASLFGLSACATGQPASAQPLLGFKSISTSTADTIRVPEGYTARVFAAWGEPIGAAGAMPAFKEDATNTAADQALQIGMHHDGMHFYPLGAASNSQRGLLVMNHEYVDDGLLHAGGMAEWTAEKVKKSQAAHGVSVIEVAQNNGAWAVVRPSSLARRFTAQTPFALSGPAAGHALMKTTADPQGRTVLGTLNNCASGKTPWGTYLSGEENFRFYFANAGAHSAHEQRWGMTKTAFFRWPEHDARFDAAKNPNEFNRFGWVVEIDPNDAQSTPVKRTALGRAAHEGAWVAITADQRAVVYSGEDARFEYIYKFVSSKPMVSEAAAKAQGLTHPQANKTLLDEGTLYVARFDANGTGAWLPLTHGQGKLTAANGFADQGEVLIKTRQASDLLGATKMDRPEWLAIHPQTGEVYCTLTNNSTRGVGANPAADAANPRTNNTKGQIIRWTERNAAGVQDHAATTMSWNHLVLAGDPANARADAKGNIKGDIFACPDGLSFDARGVLWVQTDMHASEMNKNEMVGFGNNQMLACDPATGQMRRFLTGPTNAEITGLALTPDGTTMFINVQHPGENAADRSDPAKINAFSKWPYGGRPRSATVVITRDDGGVIGA